IVRLDRQEDVKVAGRATAQARLAFASEADAGAILDAGRNIDGQLALAHHPSFAAAIGTRIRNDLPAPMATGTGALDGKEPLTGPHLAGAATGRADRRLGAGVGAGAGATFASDAGRHADLRGLAVEGLHQRDLHVVAQVGAALAAGAAAAAAAAPAHELAE